MSWLDKYSDDVSIAQKGKTFKKSVSESTSVSKNRIPISSKDMVKTIPGTNMTVNSKGEFVSKDEKGIYRPIKREQASLSQGKKKSAAELKKEQEILKEMRSNDLGLRAPLQYLANPDQMLGDLGNLTGYKPLQNFDSSDEDAIRYNYQAVDPSKTNKERLANNFNDALSLVPKAGLNLALASVASKRNLEGLIEAYNPIPLPFKKSNKENFIDDYGKPLENLNDSDDLIAGYFPRRDYNNVIGVNKIAETLPKEMEPYISKRMLNDTREQEIFESSFPVELQQILRDKRTQYLDSNGNIIESPVNSASIPNPFINNISPFLKNKKLKKGGIVKDNNGYWNPDNWGKPVEIDGNDITMEGVYEPLIGISDTGDTKLMQPGKNYKFKGKKVTEFPLAKNGINNLNANPLQKLEDLTNFTNYNQDKKEWLTKYQ